MRFLILLLLGSWSQGLLASEFSLWSEFVTYSRLHSFLPVLEELKTDLIVAVPEGSGPLKDFCRLHADAEARGLHVRPWLLLSKVHGYWFNKSNFPQAREYALGFVRKFRSECGKAPDWVTFDMESPVTLSLQLSARDVSGASLSLAVENYSALVRELNGLGVKVHAVTSHFVLNEEPGSAAVQDGKSIPFKGVPWNEISFMLYKAEFENKLGRHWFRPVNVSSRLIFDYAKRIPERVPGFLPEQTGVDLGEIGDVLYPEPFAGLNEPYELYYDVRAARAAGVRNIHIYSLDGLIERFGNEGAAAALRRFLAPTPEEVKIFEKENGDEAHEKFDFASFFTLYGLDWFFRHWF